jgi:hypothetical protein
LSEDDAINRHVDAGMKCICNKFVFKLTLKPLGEDQQKFELMPFQENDGVSYEDENKEDVNKRDEGDGYITTPPASRFK